MADVKVNLAVGGEATFKSKLNAVNSSIKSLDLQLKNVNAKIAAGDTSMETAAAKAQLLAQKTDALKQKESLLNTQLTNANAKLAANKKAMEDAIAAGDSTKIAKTTNAFYSQKAQVEKLKGELASVDTQLVNIDTNGGDAADGIGEIKDALDSIKQSTGLTALKDGLSAAMSAAKEIYNAVKGVYDFTADKSQWADDLATESAVTGIDVQTLQAWQYASRFIDTNVSAITGSIKRLRATKSTQEDALAAFGLSATNADGSEIDAQDLFFRIIDAANRNESGMSEDAIGVAFQSLFSESYDELMPLVQAGSAAWQEVSDIAVKRGLVMSDEEFGKLTTFNDNMQEAEATVDALKNEVASMLSPSLDNINAGTTNMAQTGIDLIRGIKESDRQNAMNRALQTYLATAGDAVAGGLGIDAAEELQKTLNEYGFDVQIDPDGDSLTETREQIQAFLDAGGFTAAVQLRPVTNVGSLGLINRGQMSDWATNYNYSPQMTIGSVNLNGEVDVDAFVSQYSGTMDAQSAGYGWR